MSARVQQIIEANDDNEDMIEKTEFQQKTILSTINFIRMQRELKQIMERGEPNSDANLP